MSRDPNIERQFLFSVDLEDVRSWVENGEQYVPRVRQNTYKYLEWLNSKNAKCTFFTLGELADLNGSLIKEIVNEGHEIASHGYQHTPIDQMTPEQFSEQVKRSIDSLHKAGAEKVVGYRAPIFSMTSEIEGHYDVLSNLGIQYSSSILPAKNPLYGWKEFGLPPRRVRENLVEIPVSITRLPLYNMPFAGGVYFRVLPKPLVSYLFRRHNYSTAPIVGYFHPYDVDTLQERFMHPGIQDRKIFNWLMYYNRSQVLSRLNDVSSNCKILTYSDWMDNYFRE